MVEEKIIGPFIAEHPKFSIGLDLLGYKSICETIYSTILPGLTTVTNRIRYYSFYCWLHKAYGESGEDISEKTIKTFFRKAEYLVALIHAIMPEGSPEREGIPGIEYAINELNKGTKEINLISGIYNSKGKTDRTYLKNEAYRVYSASMSMSLGLLEVMDENPNIKNISTNDAFINGKVLADSFERSIGESGNLFLAILKREKVKRDELKSLTRAFNMKNFNSLGDESEVLLQLLCQTDIPYSTDTSFLRKQTLMYYLNFVSSEKNLSTDSSLQFAEKMYLEYHNDIDTDICKKGWALYWMNEKWQFQLSNIFSNLLDILKNDYLGRWIAVHRFSSTIIKEVKEELHIKCRNVGEFYQLIKQNKVPKSKSNSSIGNCANAIISIIEMVIENEDSIIDKEEYKDVFKIAYNKDTFYSFIEEIHNHLDSELIEFFSSFIEDRIIYKHYSESMRKWVPGSNVATHKLMIENGNVRYLGAYYASSTSPRIRTLQRFLEDLGLINGNGSLTSEGKQALNSITK